MRRCRKWCSELDEIARRAEDHERSGGLQLPIQRRCNGAVLAASSAGIPLQDSGDALHIFSNSPFLTSYSTIPLHFSPAKICIAASYVHNSQWPILKSRRKPKNPSS